MGKGSKILGIILIILAIGCFAMYFLYSSKPSEYKVVFDSDGGTLVSEQIVKVGEKAIKPDNPVKEKNDFIEWQLEGKTYDFDSIVNKDITLKALWKAYNVYNVKITLEEKDYTSEVREGEVISLESFVMPAKEGYNIKLYTEDGKEYDITLPVNSDLILIGKYVEVEKYTVKFDSNGGSKVNDIKVNEGAKIDAPTVTRDGYIFDGWYLNDVKYDFSNPVTKSMTLKAKWNEGEKYTVTFTADGNTYKTVSVLENTKVTKPSNPTKSGYKFIEWQLDNQAFDFNTKITSNITLTAKFEKVTSYTVTFNSDGGSSVTSQQVEVGKKATKPADPTKKDYAFDKWTLNGQAYDFNSAVNSDITLKATWKRKYTVTFDKNNGTSNDTQTVVEGNTVTRPADPTKDRYTFDEWLYNNQTFDFSTPITKDITLTARYHLTANPDIPTE